MNKKRFSPAGQAAFARLSGDYNPIHMDDVVARRLLFGASFIHGIDALLWCLDLLCHFRDEANQRLLEVKAIFQNPMIVGEEVGIETSSVHSSRAEERNANARLIVNESAVALISANFKLVAVTTPGQLPPEPSFPQEAPSRTVEREQIG